MSYTKLAVRGAATVFIISIIAAFLGYLVRLILAKNLTVEQFGLFYAVFAFIALLSLIKCQLFGGFSISFGKVNFGSASFRFFII